MSPRSRTSLESLYTAPGQLGWVRHHGGTVIRYALTQGAPRANSLLKQGAFEGDEG